MEDKRKINEDMAKVYVRIRKLGSVFGTKASNDKIDNTVCTDIFTLFHKN